MHGAATSTGDADDIDQPELGPPTEPLDLSALFAVFGGAPAIGETPA